MATKLVTPNANDLLGELQTAISQTEALGFELITLARGVVGGLHIALRQCPVRAVRNADQREHPDYDSEPTLALDRHCGDRRSSGFAHVVPLTMQ